jgi:hypothetical protein
MATPEEVEAAAERAAIQLEQLRQDHATEVSRVMEWWQRHYARAGHRRLGRLVLGMSPYTRRDEDAEEDEATEAAIGSATQELTELRRSDAAAVNLVAQWWRGYYLMAGHRRLGRLLLGSSPSKGGQRQE